MSYFLPKIVVCYLILFIVASGMEEYYGNEKTVKKQKQNVTDETNYQSDDEILILVHKVVNKIFCDVYDSFGKIENDTEEFFCDICYYKRPVAMKPLCGHIFCSTCMAKLYFGDFNCPICRAEFSVRHQRYEFILFKNLKDLDEEILQNSFPLLPLCTHVTPNDISEWLDLGIEINYQMGGRTAFHNAVSINNSLMVNFLLKFGADINSNGRCGTPLLVAVEKGFLNLVEELIENQANVNLACTEDGITPLMLASTGGNFKIVKALLNANAKVNQKTYSGTTALRCASFHGHLKIVQLLIDHNANVNVNGFYGTPLLGAVQNRSFGIVRCLILNEADVNLADNGGNETPLTIAASDGSFEIAEALIAAKADVNKQPQNIASPLRIASFYGNLEIVKLLVANGADIDTNGPYGTPLFSAAGNGNLDVVKFLIENNANIDLENTENNATPLMVASEAGYFEVIETLLHAGVEVDKHANCGTTALRLASIHGDIKLVKLLIDHKANVNANGIYGTPLNTAVHSENLEIVRYLIQNKADVNLGDTVENLTPLMLAVQIGNFEIIEALLDANAEVNKQAKSGTSALQLAALDGNINFVKLLVDHDANIDANGFLGTPLFSASEFGHFHVVEFLIQSHADVNLGSWEKKATPLMVASEEGYIKIVKALISANAEINRQTKCGSSALYLASTGNYLEVVKILMKHKAKININGHHGTPLFGAAQHGNLQVVRYLIENGADINLACTDINATPLMVASEHGYDEVVKALLELNAKVNKKTKNGNFALRLASMYGHLTIVKLLIGHQAKINLRMNFDGSTALMISTQEGNFEVVKYLTQNGANPFIRSYYGLTAFDFAANHDYISIYQFLVQLYPSNL